MSKRIFIVVVLAAFAVCAVAVAQQRKVIDEARFGTVEVKRTHSHVIKPAGVLVVPWHINYQGYLTDDVGNPINDTLSMTFGIWDDPGVGSELWNENGNVVVEEGLFNVVLGSTTPIPSDVFGAGQSRWLELTIIAQTLSPRTEITSVGYAYRSVKADSADDADMVDGFDASPTPGPNDLFPLSAGDVRYVNEGQTDAITSDMILDGSIARGDAEAAFKAPYADTADYALAANVGYVDSAGVSGNSWRLENNTLMNLDSRWVNENQANAITSSMILDGQVGTSDLGDLSVATQKIGDDAVTSGKIFDGTIVRTDVDAAFKAPYADTADYALAANVAYVDSAGVSANSWRLENNTPTDLDGRWVNEGQADAITGAMILDGQVGTSDLGDLSVATQKIGNDAVTTLKIFDGAVVNSKVANDAVTSANIFDGTIVRGDVEAAFKAPYSDTADYALGAPASPDNDWTIAGSVLYPSAAYGLAMRSFNVLYGVYDTTHVNLGIACTTGTSGQDRAFCTVSGGYNNSAGYDYATVGGGSGNMASGYHGTVSGGENSSAIGQYAVVGGGRDNTASGNGAAIGGGGMNAVNGDWAVVGGGWANAATGNLASVGGGESNTASGYDATVGGGGYNVASDSGATVSGGGGNIASGLGATVAGGAFNTASDSGATVSGGGLNSATALGATVGGGSDNTTSGLYSTVPGGYGDTVAGDFSFAAGRLVRITGAADHTFAFGRNFTTSTPNAVIFHNSVDPIRVGMGTTSPTATLDVNGSTGYDQVRMRTSYTPTGSADANGNVGDIAWDDDYMYMKTSAGWKRAALSAW